MSVHLTRGSSNTPHTQRKTISKLLYTFWEGLHSKLLNRKTKLLFPYIYVHDHTANE